MTANTMFGELLRLPTLIHHYLEHCEWDNNNSVIDFLSKHYSGVINHPDDQHNDHQKLPFKSADGFTAQVVTVMPPALFELPRIVPETNALKKSPSLKQDYSNHYLNSIWQPPRLS
ncbi:MAG TPA: hypothetical protein PKE30_12140 [Niabella sp.]|nr:hypothetical protein [Niabella sp.]